MGSNTGFSHAVNCGIQACTTEWLAIVNSDVEPAPDWLDRLIEAEGLQQVRESRAEKSMLELLGHIFSTIQKFMGDCPQFDDVTAAILHCSGS
jgi:glycosyltransferase involved in cell wall biosynthesis